jgi:hypothetical protein
VFLLSVVVVVVAVVVVVVVIPDSDRTFRNNAER